MPDLQPQERHPLLRDEVLVAGLALLYFLAGRFGLSMPVAEGAATLVWPPTGLGIAALLVCGRKLWPGIAIGAFAVNYSTGQPLAAALGIAGGNTLEALLAYTLFTRAAGGSAAATDPFSSVRRTLAFILLATLLAPIASATIGVVTLTLSHTLPTDPLRTWLLWWLGDVMGALLLSPLLVLLTQRGLWRKQPDRERRGRTGRGTEWFMVLASALVVSIAIYAGTLPEPLSARLGLVPYLFVLWTALRMSMLGTVMVSLAVSAGAIAGTLASGGAPQQLIVDVMYLYAFLFIQTASALLVAAVVRERREALADAEQARQVAQEASLQKSRILANMSHEIRTPLNGIIGMTALLEDDVEGPEARERLRIVQSSADSLLNVLNDIIDHARIEAGKVAITPRRFSPAALVRDVVGLFNGQAELQGIPLHARLDGSLPPQAYADDNRLRQVLVNVLSNALKFTERGEILVQAMRDHSRPGNLLLVVTDSGIGIPPEALAQVFEPFVQVDGSSTRRHGGSGLGLTISKQLVERMNGSLEIESTPGIGTQVAISVPAPETPPAIDGDTPEKAFQLLSRPSRSMQRPVK